MTKDIVRLERLARETLLRGPWPPTQRVMVDAFVSLATWRATGAHVFRLRDGMRSPALEPGLVLANAVIRREAQLYVLGRTDWIVVARVAALRAFDVGPARSLAFRDPLLTYCTLSPEKALLSGYFNLREMPTPRQLKLAPGTTISELWTRQLEADEISVEALRLVRVLPWFFQQA